MYDDRPLEGAYTSPMTVTKIPKPKIKLAY